MSKEAQNMSSFRKFIKSIYHQIMDDTDDPAYKLNQYLIKMNKEIISAKEVISKQINFRNNFNQQLLEAEKLVTKRDKQADIAKKAGEEELAQKAIAESKYYTEKVQEYTTYVAETEAGIKELKEQLGTLEREYQNVLDKKNSLVARVTRANALAGIQFTLNSLQSDHFRGEIGRFDQTQNEKKDTTEDDLDEIDKSINQLKKDDESDEKPKE